MSKGRFFCCCYWDIINAQYQFFFKDFFRLSLSIFFNFKPTKIKTSQKNSCYIALKLAKNQLKQLKVRILDAHFFQIFVKSKSKAHNFSHHEILIDISHIRLVEPGTTGWGLAKMDEHCWKSLSHPALLTKTLEWLR